MAPNSPSSDAFLGGRLRLRQPPAGFRAGIDSVLLAASVPAASGQSALDLGCGVGTASLCLAARVPGLRLTGLELQPDYAALAMLNAAETGLPLEVLTGDVAAPPPALTARSFDHVFANPPFFAADGRTFAADTGRETARGEAVPLAGWIETAVRRLRPGGTLTLVQRIERLPDLLRAIDSRLGAAEVLPLAPRRNRASRLFLFRAVKGRRSPFVLHPPVILHRGDAHLKDAESYTEAVTCVLRDGAAMPWPGASAPNRQK